MINNKLGIFIQARINSTRLRNKTILDIQSNKSLIDLILEKLKKYNELYTIIICTGNKKYNYIFEDYAKKYNVEVFFGDEHNVLERFLEAGLKYNLTHILRVCSDNPFLQTTYIDLLIETLKKDNSIDYISFCNKDNIPSILSHLGFFTEIVSVKSLAKQKEEVSDINILEHVTKHVYSNPNEYKNLFLQIPEDIDRRDIRLTIDDIVDFEICQEILKKIKADESAINIIKYVDSNKFLKNKMIINIKKYSK